MQRVQEISSWWAWNRGDGSAYAPSRIPAFWLRVAYRRWQDARDQFGPLADHAQHISPELVTHEAARRQRPEAETTARMIAATDASDWETLHYRLKAMGRLWQPWPHNRQIYGLVPFNTLQHDDAAALRATLDMACAHGELVPRLDGWQLRVVPQSLRGFLLMSCAADVAAKRRFRRCDQCHEWFPVARADAKFCSAVCRQAAHQSAKMEQ
jgi:hypothetical protein